MKKTAITGVALAVVAGVVVGGLSTLVGAATETTNQTVQVTTTDVISLNTNGQASVTIAADPTENGGFGAISSPLSVSTNNATGANLTLSMVQGDAATTPGSLYDSTTGTTDFIAGIPATGALAANQWGYTTTASPNASTSFSRVPAFASPVTLATSAAEGPLSSTVNFGAVVDFSLAGGVTYSNVVTFTASTNPAP